MADEIEDYWEAIRLPQSEGPEPEDHEGAVELAEPTTLSFEEELKYVRRTICRGLGLPDEFPDQ